MTRRLPVIAFLTVALIAAFGTGVARAALSSTEATHYYRVYGSTEDELRASLNKLGPGAHDGSAYGYITWNYRYRIASSGSCSISASTTKLVEKFTMPQWVPPTDASAALQTKWDAYLTHLWTHERGHQQISINTAKRISAALARVGSRSTCSQVGAAANQRAVAFLAQQGRLQVAYDARTQHGATQGAVFP